MDAMKTMTHAEMDAAVESMSEEEREYLRLLVCRVVQCFTKGDSSAVLLFSVNGAAHMSVCTVNAEEDKAYELVDHAHQLLGFTAVGDVPPKEMFN